MGIVHGMTNLGGALLSAIVFSKSLSKEQTRATIAVCYLTFAVFQLITLFFLFENSELFSFNKILFLFVGLFAYFLIENHIYSEIESKSYFNAFLFISGLLLIVRSD